MPSVVLNGQALDPSRYQMHELDSVYQSPIGQKLAGVSTRNNGIDEIFIQQHGKTYVIASDNLDLSDAPKGNLIQIDGQKADTLSFNNEVNAHHEKVKSMAGQAIRQGLSNGVGGMLAGLAVMAVESKIMGGSKFGLAAGAAVGFISGFAWGAGSSITSDLENYVDADWKTITELAAEKQNALAE